MEIIKNLDELHSPPTQAVVTIGNFDGVHLGHRAIFHRVVQKARQIGGTSIVYTFVPHPLKVVAPSRAPRMINTVAEKERLIEASCIDILICAPFTREVAAMPAFRFVEDVLVGKIGVKHLIVGYDYAFGRNREGDIAFLKEKGGELGFAVEVLEPINDGEEVYSSTRLRQMISDGDVSGVVKPLGRHFTFEGTVVHGAKRGAGMGFPTANLSVDKEVLPKPGVYAVKVKRGKELFDGVVNIGNNPTFGDQALSVEVHLFDFSEQIYGETLRVYFFERLRDEKRFDSVSALVQAIDVDIERARQILSVSTIIEFHEYLDCKDFCSIDDSPN